VTDTTGRATDGTPAAGTWTEQQLLDDVRAAPSGPAVGAFFDFDGTVIDGYSVAAFMRHHLRSLDVTPVGVGQLLLTGLRGVTTEEDFERFTIAGMRAWAGRSEDELTELGERLFVQGIAGSLYPEAWRLVAAHLDAGHTVVLASSATRFQVEPAARALGVEHVLVSPVEIVDGVCTGARAGRCCGAPARRRRCGRSPRSTASTWRRATPTRTATRTCRSSARSGAPARSTPGAA
jgi:phosphoserine phosphatase